MTIWQRLAWLFEQALIAFFLVCLALVVWFHPWESAWYVLVYGGAFASVIGILILCANWSRLRLALLLRQNPEVLSAASEAFSAHADHLAEEMRRSIRWDARSDYILDDWVPILDAFIDTEVKARLGARHRAMIEQRNAPLRQEVFSLINGKTYDRMAATGPLP